MTLADRLKTTVASLVTAAGLYYSLLGLVQSPASLRTAVFVGTLAAAGALMYFTDPGQRFLAYCKAAAVEVRKVVWPEREEVLKMSGVVLMFVTVVAIFLWLVDAFLSWLLQFLAL